MDGRTDVFLNVLIPLLVSIVDQGQVFPRGDGRLPLRRPSFPPSKSPLPKHNAPIISSNTQAGGIAGTTVDVVLFPLDTLKTRLQSSAGFWAAGGFQRLYAGIIPAAAASAPAGQYAGSAMPSEWGC